MRQCSVDGCQGRHAAKGWCRKHYMRVYKNGDLDLHNAEPFEEKYTVSESGCWIWARSTDKDGYGKMSVAGRDARAHRFSWERANGPIPAGLLVCHSCDTPSCVNPGHLFIGTHKDNHEDRGKKQRTAAGERHGNSILSLDQVGFLRTSRPGEKYARERFGISRTQYYRVIRGEGWREANV